MAIYDIAVTTLDGRDTTIGEFAGKALLIVNVASQCGLTPQYTQLESIQERFADAGFAVLGFPCNQFGGQEPGTTTEIATFCSTNYGVTFPLFDKIDVNGDAQHPLYTELTKTPDGEGKDGDVVWNFEKFLVSPQGEVVARFRPLVEPSSDELVAAIEAQLAAVDA